MKISKIHTLWLCFLSCLYTAKMCAEAIYKTWKKTLSREWIDQRMQKWVKQLIHLIGIRYTIVNPHKVTPKDGQPTIIMCNHSSLFDIPISYLAFPEHSLRMLAKKEMSKIPLMGRAMVASEFPFIDRKNRHQAIKDLAAIHRILESGIILWIAPEGTRSKSGRLAAFKKGGFITAIQAKATIIPIGIRGAYDILPAKTMQLKTNQAVEIHIGKPIDAGQYQLEDKENLLAKVHQQMQELVGENNG